MYFSASLSSCPNLFSFLALPYFITLYLSIQLFSLFDPLVQDGDSNTNADISDCSNDDNDHDDPDYIVEEHSDDYDSEGSVATKDSGKTNNTKDDNECNSQEDAELNGFEFETPEDESDLVSLKKHLQNGNVAYLVFIYTEPCHFNWFNHIFNNNKNNGPVPFNEH